MRSRTKVENKTSIWSLNFRPRTGSSTTYNGFYWTNTTGRNSEPGVGTDWTNSGAITASQAYIIWNGYRLYKTSGGGLNYPETGDELQGRGDGRYKSAEWIHCEILRDLPDAQPTNEDLDINLFTSYP
nr:hypothetical protein [uncultured Allomuricauda sp.]